MAFLHRERRLLPAFAVLLAICCCADAAPARLNVLFLGDKGPHRPAERFKLLAPALKTRGIDLTYTDRVADLNATTLGKYDALVIYANIDRITPEQEKALLDHVAGGKGFVPLHCASYCFRNSPAYVALVGAQFRSHGDGEFRTTIVKADHPVMKGFGGFRSWDETYVHTRHNAKDRVILEERVDGGVREPWTWVRTHGKGRVFYTAWGHDHRTWGHAGFHNLVERGIRWSAGGDPGVVPAYSDGAARPTAVEQPTMTTLPTDLQPFRYADAKVPFYPAGKRGGTVGKPLTKMQLPVSPQESMRHMVTPTDFEVKLFADETLLGGKPICMNWDERGRLWVAISLDYPNQLQRAGNGRDRIVVVEDTDGDGKADKVTTFADKLSIPTSLTFHRGGLIVHQAPQTLFLKDTDGDGKADRREVLFAGWDTRDTHAGPSNLRYGLDNWLYSMDGYSGFRGTVGGERVTFRQGFFRFQPDGSRIEFLRNTNNNSWGVGFSEEGLLFGSTANGNPSVFLPIPNRYYERVRGWSSSVLPGIAGNVPMHPITDKVRQVDWHGHFTAAAGHALYTARTYPRAYWNSTAFVAEPTGHLVATFVLERRGSDFRSRNAWNLLASQDEWTAPIMAEVGPDGHVWVLDWYNYIVQHNPTPVGFTTGKGNAYETELRDKKHGRIYRLVHKKGKPSKAPVLDATRPETLVAALKHDNMFWRLHAQRLLVERGNHDVLRALFALVEDRSVDDIGLNVGAIHALWTIHGLGGLQKQHIGERTVRAVHGALTHPSAGVRRNAALVLPPSADSAHRILEGRVHRDADAQVRLAAYLALAEMPATEQVGKALAEALTREPDLADRWLPDAITSAAAAHDWYFLRAVAESPAPLSPAAANVVQVVAEHWARGRPVDRITDFLRSLRLRRPDVAGTILAGLARGWREGVKPDGFDARGALLVLPRLDPAGKVSLLRLLAAMGAGDLDRHVADLVQPMLATAVDDKAAEADRVAAARQLIQLRPADEKAVVRLVEAITFRTPPAVVAGLLDAVGQSTARGAGPAILGKLSSWTPAARTAGIRVLLSRTTSTAALLDAIDKGTVKLSDLALDQKQALASYPDKVIAERARKLLAKGGDLPSADRVKVIEALTPLLKKTGNAVKGKEVFKAQCAKCHAHSGEGTNIGPDLTGMAAHPKEELLVHILDPSRSVEGTFRVWSATTTDGKVFAGMLASETRTTVELIDAEAKRTTIQRENIEELTQSNKSLMPDGFEKQLKEPELVDLLEFLTQKGKYLPLPLDRVATAVSTQGMFNSRDSTVERLVFDDWKPKTFEGVPFILVDPRGDKVKNVVLLYGGPERTLSRTMPKSVSVPCNTPARAVHLLSGIAGWGSPFGRKGSVSLIVRLHYKDGTSEDHRLLNGEHIADYIRRVDVPGSKFAFALGGRQVRYLSVQPKRSDTIERIELVKGSDGTAPVVMAVTVEPR